MSFVHLHLHTEFSLLDGAIKVTDLVRRVSDLGQGAVAITDHGWIAGAVKLQKECAERDVKPIIGMETYVATQDDMREKAEHGGDNYHLTLLAQNEEGYRNLMALTSLAHVEGLHYKPRIDKKTLAKYSEGVIVLSGCVAAELPQLLVQGREREAEALVEWYQDTFGDRFFIELMAHGSQDGVDHVQVEGPNGEILMGEGELNDALLRLGDRHSVGVIATNDAHYLVRDHGDAHDTLLCLQMGKWKENDDRLRFPGADHEAWEFYVKDEDEMLAMSDRPGWETACANTVLLADMIEPEIVPMGDTVLPSFEITPELEVATRVWEETGEVIL